MASTTRQLVRAFARQQRFAINTTCQRSLHTTLVRLNETNSHFAEKLADKFIGQVKEHGKSRQGPTAEPTRFVQIDSLPPTATTEDVRKIAREAFTHGDKSIIETVFVRNNEFNFYGRAVVCMATPEDARKLLEYGNRRTVGGQIIRMAYIATTKSDPSSVLSALRRPELTSITDSTSASGRAVVITGFPFKTQPEHLLGYLRSRNFFPLDGASDNVVPLKTKNQSTVSKFLVKFDTESEAWRCVRTFHNTDFLLKHTNQKYRLSLNVVY